MSSSQVAPQFVTSHEEASLVQWRGPLFVAGAWRSGTSLLYALLNKHPQIGLMYEGDLFLLRPMFRVPGAGSKWLARWEFWNTAPTRHGLDTARLPLTISQLPNDMERVYREYARQKGAFVWGEKSPHLLRYPPTRLVQDFPGARFIFIWRDPAAICRSIIRAGGEDRAFFGRRGMTHRALMGSKALKVECDRLISRGAAVHQIHYETLVKDPAGVMADVCRFLGVPFDPGITSLEGADRSAIHEGMHHSLVKSQRIVSSLQRPEVLPTELKGKIERYISLWEEESGGKWPILSPPNKADSPKPSLRERFVDRALYLCLETYDSLVVFIYCFAPLWLLRRFRALKRGHEQSLRGVAEKVKLSGSSES
jgi:hypothetical protein